MSKETVYRVEDADGNGPYVHADSDVCYRMRYSHTDDPSRPAPLRSFGVRPSSAYLYGFTDMRQLYAWFGGWLPQLIREGYRVVKHTGRVDYRSDHQVAFTNWKVS